MWFPIIRISTSFSRTFWNPSCANPASQPLMPAPPPAGQSRDELFLKELMDNCIYVTHQFFDMAKTQEEFSRFMVTGFIFNSIICSLNVLEGESEADDGSGEKGKIH